MSALAKVAARVDCVAFAAMGAATTLVVGIALVATMVPAYRAAQLDPARVLRQ